MIHITMVTQFCLTLLEAQSLLILWECYEYTIKFAAAHLRPSLQGSPCSPLQAVAAFPGLMQSRINAFFSLWTIRLSEECCISTYRMHAPNGPSLSALLCLCRKNCGKLAAPAVGVIDRARSGSWKPLKQQLISSANLLSGDLKVCLLFWLDVFQSPVL